MTPLHGRLRLRQGAWDGLGDTYAPTLVRDGLRLAWWSGPQTNRLAPLLQALGPAFVQAVLQPLGPGIGAGVIAATWPLLP